VGTLHQADVFIQFTLLLPRYGNGATFAPTAVPAGPAGPCGPVKP
jgi:hypothetical protein